MYLEHFGLAEPPFSITPDPRFVYLSERHRDALAHLSYGIGQGGGGGFVQLTGEVGTGKTTLCRLLLEQLPENTRVALVLNPRVSPVELLETVCEELRLELDGRRGSVKALVDALNAYLLDAYARGLRVVLIIDEAQNLSFDALEQVRLLTNLETATQKLLQIVLLGQPELRTMLAREELRQLAQRITARYHLTPLSAAETGEYLRHRIAVAGGPRALFTPAAAQRVHARTGGVPRLINVVAERALLAGYVHERASIDEALVDRAADEALAPSRAATRLPDPRRLPPIGVAAAVLALVALAVTAWQRVDTARVVAQSQATAVAAPVAAGGDPRRSPAPPADFAARLKTATDSGATAWAELLRQWDLPRDAAAIARFDACAPVPAPGLHCARGQAPLDELATLGRPLILALTAPAGRVHAVLQGVDGGSAQLWLDGATFDVPRETLAAHWAGDYTALWSATQLHTAPLPRDGRGPAVDWLRARLGHEGPAVFDNAMRDALRAFQRRHGLAADGVPGPATRLRLAGADDGPRLQTRVE